MSSESLSTCGLTSDVACATVHVGVDSVKISGGQSFARWTKFGCQNPMFVIVKLRKVQFNLLSFKKMNLIKLTTFELNYY
jgi:hypothetical protein